MARKIKRANSPKEAVQAHRILQAKHSIGVHWGTFQLSAEGREQPVVDLQAAIQEYQLKPDEFIVMQPGESRLF
jgi:L-ascorbate metabolism protein UlaG (beta-lactamase superfamily)